MVVTLRGARDKSKEAIRAVTLTGKSIGYRPWPFGYAAARAIACVLAVLMLLAASLFSTIADAAAQPGTGKRKVALVIGNSVYQHTESLANPVNDSVAMRDALTRLGFEVFSGENVGISQFRKLVGDFKTAAETSETALVYFSGHGFQLRGLNYLVPSDAALKSEGSIGSETIRLDTLISDIQGSGRQTLVFLDACRNNPLPPSQRRDDGLAQIQAGNGVFVAFATQPGNISYDGRSQLSPFTKAIVNHIGTPGQNISDLMINVRNDVERMTLHQQTPWDQSSLKRQVYLGGEKEQPPLAAGEAMASLAPGAAGSEISTLERSTGVAAGDDLDTLIGPSDNVLVLPTVPGQPSNVILLPDAPIEIFGREDLVQGVQSELARVGCYDDEVDGVWGGSSRDALVRYYQTKKLKLQDASPTEFHYDNLKREAGIVCVAPKPSYAPPQRVAKPDRDKPAYNPPARRTAKERDTPSRRSISKPARTANANESKPRQSSRPSGRNPASQSRPAPAAAAEPKKKVITNTRVLGAFR